MAALTLNRLHRAELAERFLDRGEVPVVLDLELIGIALQRTRGGEEGEVFLHRISTRAIFGEQPDFNAFGECRNQLVDFQLLDIGKHVVRVAQSGDRGRVLVDLTPGGDQLLDQNVDRILFALQPVDIGIERFVGLP